MQIATECDLEQASLLFNYKRMVYEHLERDSINCTQLEEITIFLTGAFLINKTFWS